MDEPCMNAPYRNADCTPDTPCQQAKDASGYPSPGTRYKKKETSSELISILGVTYSKNVCCGGARRPM